MWAEGPGGSSDRAGGASVASQNGGSLQRKIDLLTAALEHNDPEQREHARHAPGFIERTSFRPGNALLQVAGNLGEMLTAASGQDA
jgi:hypothetical protein